MTITCTPPPLANPGDTVKICLSNDCLPGTVSFDCNPKSSAPGDLILTVDNPCADVVVPSDCISLVAVNDDSQDLVIA